MSTVRRCARAQCEKCCFATSEKVKRHVMASVVQIEKCDACVASVPSPIDATGRTCHPFSPLTRGLFCSNVRERDFHERGDFLYVHTKQTCTFASELSLYRLLARALSLSRAHISQKVVARGIRNIVCGIPCFSYFACPVRRHQKTKFSFDAPETDKTIPLPTTNPPTAANNQPTHSLSVPGSKRHVSMPASLPQYSCKSTYELPLPSAYTPPKPHPKQNKALCVLRAHPKTRTPL